MGALSARPAVSNDRTLAIIAGASIVVSVAAVLARLLGVLPEGPSTLIVIVGAAIALKIALSYAAKAASDASRARVMNLVSTVALAISGVIVLASLPRITKMAGMHVFVLDLCAQLWTLGILWLVAGPVRTMNWRVFVGTGMTGFLGLTAIARLVGVPAIERMGATSIVAAALWVPITEEIVKMLPVMLVLVLAMRRTSARPSALDVTMLGAWAGAGFALFESATLGRGGFSLTTNAAFSLVIPSEGRGVALGMTIAQTGHLVHTALIALGVSFALFYPRHFARRWIVPAVAIAAVLVEHCSQNAIITGVANPALMKVATLLTGFGRLTSILLIGGVAYVARMEWRIVGGSFASAASLKLTSAEASRRSVLLANAQTGDVS